MEEIRFDFQIARQQEQRLDELAGKIEHTVRGSYSDALQELKSAWQSDGSLKFTEKGQILEEKMLKNAALIGQARDALRRAYMKAESIEKKVKEIAENRTADK